MNRRAIKRNCRRIPASRRGAITVLVAVTIAMLLMFAAFSVNLAYMQVMREQLRVASDAAAKAALVKLGATQDKAAAAAFGRQVAERNLVGGKPPQIDAGDIVFGNAVSDKYGIYSFKADAMPLNAAQVTGSATRPLFLRTFMPTGSFTTSQTSVTTRISHDVCLVLDRSASMAFDLSNREFTYPPDVSEGKHPLQSYFTPPSPTTSRWQALSSAVRAFIGTLQDRNLDVNVALVTYAEYYSFGAYGATDASLDVNLTQNYRQIIDAMDAWGRRPLLGDTNIEAGLALAATEMTGPRSRLTADRTIILLTDGVPTSGNPDVASLTLNSRGNSQIVTHVITFGGQASSGTYQALMMNAAANGNGMFFNAPTSEQLQEAFQSIADSLPAVLIN